MKASFTEVLVRKPISTGIVSSLSIGTEHPGTSGRVKGIYTIELVIGLDRRVLKMVGEGVKGSEETVSVGSGFGLIFAGLDSTGAAFDSPTDAS